MFGKDPYATQPVRTSYNMLFAHFKQQGYSDELAGAEANRLMRQSMGAVGPVQTQHVAPTPNSAPSVSMDRSSLLSGIKIAQKPVGAPMSFKIPVNAGVAQSPGKNVIPIMLKANRSDSERKVRVSDVNAQEKTPNVPPAFANNFYIDTKPSTTSTSPVDDPLSMEDINEWLKQLYNSLNITKCSRENRNKVSKYVEGIISDFRAGKLKRQHLVIPEPKVIFGAPEPVTLSQSEPPVENPIVAPNPVDSKPKLQRDIKVPKNSKRSTPKETVPFPDETSNVAEAPKPGRRTSKKGGKAENTSKFKQAAAATGANAIKAKQNAKTSPQRAQMPAISGANNAPIPAAPNANAQELQKRLERFQRFQAMPTGIYNFQVQKGVAIVGQSRELEKPFLRLTAEPNPMLVRPEEVLKLAFKHVFDTFLNNRNYRYIEEQFRSIRQDIQVQHLKSAFVVNIYATNARIALIHGDLDQFNQCQTQLIHLHCIPAFATLPTRHEFECYRFLYLALQHMDMDMLRYLKTNMNLYKGLGNFINAVPRMSFANNVRCALSQGNFVRYFQLANTHGIDRDKCLIGAYKEAFLNGEPQSRNVDDYCKLLFKMFEPRFRMTALVAMARSSLSLSVDTIYEALAFASRNDCVQFLEDAKSVYTSSGLIDSKKSWPIYLESPLLRNKKL